MLGPDRFAFETPNVIDPGDLPPSQPVRPDQPSEQPLRAMGMNGDGGNPLKRNGHHHNDDNASETSSLTMPVSNRYHDERSARLLRDISDLDLTPPSIEPYDPYRNDDDNKQDDDDLEDGASIPVSQHHSLPSVDEARMYAASLLQDSQRRGGHSIDFQRTIKLRLPTLSRTRDSNPHPHVLRKQVMRRVCQGMAVVLVVVVIAVVVATAGHPKTVSDPPSSSNSSTTPSSTNDSDQDTELNMRQPIKGVDIQQRREEILSFLIDQGVTSRYDLEDPKSPQSKAADWLAQYDLLIRPVPALLHSRQRFVQRYALATLYYALSGHEWTKDYKFLSAEDECGWYEPTSVRDYAAQTTAFGVTCDPNLQVQSLFVPDNNLKGSLPSELRFLSALDMIAMPNNAIRGTIPRELHSWSNLVYVDLKYNRISGMLPSWIGDLSKLEVLGLSNNEFAGGVPANFGSLGRLKTLALDDNALSGDLDWVNHLTNLQFFYGERNMFTGRIDDNFLADLPRLKELDLSSTALTGRDFPLHLLEHPTLEVVDLSHNEMSGSLPEIPDENTVLKYLGLSHCNLTGSIPQSLPRLRGLDHLDLTGNSFAGTIPNILGQMTNLKFLFLGQNNFDAVPDMPPLFSQLTQLRELSLDSTNLGGTIPSWLSYLEYLKLLNLSNNNLVGTIPQAVWDLPKLGFLLLHKNQLNGEIPASVEVAGKLQILTLFENSFSGDVSQFCDANPKFSLIAADCAVSCDPSCCEKCCEAGQQDCFQSEVPMYLSGYEGMWEYGFDRASYSFDPVILHEPGAMTTQGGEDMPSSTSPPPSETMIGDTFHYPVEQKPNDYLPEPVDPTVTMENFTVPTNGGGSP